MAGAHRAPTGPTWLEHVLALLAERDRREAERDRRYEQRFEAQQVALQAALTADRNAVAAALGAQERATQTAMQASEKAIEKAERAVEGRLILLNELRGTVPTREEFNSLVERLSDQKGRLDKLEGRSGGQSALYGYIVAGVGVILAVVAFVAR